MHHQSSMHVRPTSSLLDTRRAPALALEMCRVPNAPLSSLPCVLFEVVVGVGAFVLAAVVYTMGWVRVLRNSPSSTERDRWRKDELLSTVQRYIYDRIRAMYNYFIHLIRQASLSRS
jgi:hypothetical protein